jgi:LacI family transcriptional regulator
VKPQASRVTLIDVAAASGVSASTVSRVLHGGAGVRDEVAARVRVTADALGYSVNQQARSLRRGRDEAIGIVVEDFTVPFFGVIVAVAERLARERGYGVVIACAGTGSTSEQPAVRKLVSRNVSGLLISNGAGPAPSSYLPSVAGDLPVVVVDAPRPDAHADTVTVDNAGGARRATEHLLAHGHREVLFVGSALSATTVARRHEGYLEAMRAAGLEPREEYSVWAGHRTEDVRPVIHDALLKLPSATAIFSSGARTTPGVLSAMVALGRRGMGFTGFDDVVAADAFSPGLTVLDQHPDRIGEQAMRLLFERIDGYVGPARHVQVALTLLTRGSGEVPPPAVPAPPVAASSGRTRRRPAAVLSSGN